MENPDICRNFMRQMSASRINKITPSSGRKASQKTVRLPELKEFDYSEFRKTADKVPFTLGEWAAIFHLSERTLQRYAQSNASFAPIHAERFHQIEQLIGLGKKVFGKISAFSEWLHTNPPALEGNLGMQSLESFEGIRQVKEQLERIQQGLLA